MKNRQHNILLVSLLMVCGSLFSCQSNKTPMQVSEHFWLGMETNNLALVKKYSLTSSIDEAEDLSVFDEITATEFGRIVIDGDIAEIDTIVTTFLNEEKVDIKIETHLEKNNDVWKVNYEKTVHQLKLNQNMAEVFDNIEDMTEEITAQIEESVEEMKEKVMPEIKSEIDKAEEEIREKVPELKNIFEQFLEELGRSLEKLIPQEADEEINTQET